METNTLPIVTLEELLVASEKTGLGFVSKIYYTKDYTYPLEFRRKVVEGTLLNDHINCGCPMTILCVHETNQDLTSFDHYAGKSQADCITDITKWAYSKYGMEYTKTFMSGFDGLATFQQVIEHWDDEYPELLADTERTRLGFEHGRRIRQALIEQDDHFRMYVGREG